MQEKSDGQLLRDYADRGHESAFREIVARYTDLVYSAALRQVKSSAAACDIAQTVFTDLARKAGMLASDGGTAAKSLAGWLHRATRYAALNYLRDARRQRANEKQAMEQLLANSEPATDWEQIRPLLDEALDSLGDGDREALLLRYFKNQDFRAVGLALGVSDDAAQKRVSRALERLREFFSKRNVMIGASGLAVLISSNAVQSAPVGLAAAISTAAFSGTSVSTSTAIAATKTIAMTALQKTIVGAALIAAVGTGVYEAHQAVRLRHQVQTLQEQRAPLAGQMQELQHERDDATNQLSGLLAENVRLQADQKEAELLKLRGEVARLRSEVQNLDQSKAATADDPVASAAKSWLDRVNELKQRMEHMPGRQIPEMRLLTDQDWLRITSKGSFKTDAEVRRALYHLREDAKEYFAPMIGKALGRYVAANAGQLPTMASQLAPYFGSPMAAAALQRYQMLKTGAAGSLQKNEMVIGEKAPVDPRFDALLQVGLNGYRIEGIGDIHSTFLGDFTSSAHYDPSTDRRLDQGGVGQSQ